MTTKRLQLDKTIHWQPFKYQGKTYDLSHLDAHKVIYIQKKIKDKAENRYTFYVTYAFHCFAKDYPHLTALERQDLLYTTIKDSRAFCFIRYNLSLSLPEIINNLSESFMFHSGYESYATYVLKDADGNQVDYYVSLVVYKEKKKLRLHVKSAYPLNKPLGKRKKTNFFAIAYNLRKGKKLPTP